MDWARSAWLLAQAAEPEQGLSTNLKWLSFPQATSETVTMFFAVLMAIVITVILTLYLQSMLQSLLDRLPRRSRQKANMVLQRLDAESKSVLDRLKPVAETKYLGDLVTDSTRLEHAIARYIAKAPVQEDLSGFSRLRRRLSFTVMNPAVPLVSTRQLLPDLTVRLMATIGAERLDLYCPLLEVSERYLLIDLPYRKEFYDLLSSHPEVYLVYWREPEGETAFKVKLMPLQSGHISAFRSEHAVRSEDAAARSDFRLTMDLPLTYQFVDLESVALHKQTGQEVHATRGEGKLIDLSFGGASFLADQPIVGRGFAQLHFMLGEYSVRAMLEVLFQSPAADGKTLLRGQFRGLTHELSGMLRGFLSKEQFKRIQLRTAIRMDSEVLPSEIQEAPAAADAGGTAVPAAAPAGELAGPAPAGKPAPPPAAPAVKTAAAPGAPAAGARSAPSPLPATGKATAASGAQGAKAGPATAGPKPAAPAAKLAPAAARAAEGKAKSEPRSKPPAAPRT